MPFSNQKILWGFVEKNSLRVEGYQVFIRHDGEEIETTTNENGFYQFNLGNFHVGFHDGDTFWVEAVGDTSYHGESSILLLGGTTTQQVPTIEVVQDLDSPILVSALPAVYSIRRRPEFVFQIEDMLSGPDETTLSVTIDSVQVVNQGICIDSSFSLTIEYLSRKIIIVRVTRIDPQYADGQEIYTSVSINDKVGNNLLFVHSITIDATPPFVSAFSPAEGAFSTDPNTEVIINLDDLISGVDPDSIKFKIDGLEYSIASPNLSYAGGVLTFIPTAPFDNGEVFEWDLVADDLAGNRMNHVSHCFVVLSDPPQLINPVPEPNSFTNDQRPNIHFDIVAGSSPINLLSFYLEINNDPVFVGDPRLILSSSSAVFVPATDLSGIVTVEASVSDNLGITATISWTFQIDTIAPTVVIIYPQPGQFVRSDLSPITLELLDDAAGIDPDSISLSVNGNVYSISSPELTFSSAGVLTYTPSIPLLLNDANSVAIAANDLAGNPAVPVTYEFFVDAEPPYIISVIPEPGSNTNDLSQPIQIRIADDLSGIDASSLIVTVNGVEYFLGDLYFDGELIEIVPSSPFDETSTVIISIYVRDNVGNVLNREVSSFGFDLTPFEVLSISPDDQSFRSSDPNVIEVQFNKDLDLSESTKDVDYKLEERDATDPLSVFSLKVLDTSSGVSLTDENILSLYPLGGFEINREYRITLTNRIKDTAGNKLEMPEDPDGTEVFSSTFVYYQPGDLLIRGSIGASDLYKYFQVISGCDNTIVAVPPELADLNGDGLVNDADLLVLQDLILGIVDISDISSAGSVSVNNLAIPIIDGTLDALVLSGFDSKAIGDKTEGNLVLGNPVNLAAFQADIVFDPNVLSLINVIPLAEMDLFRFHVVSPGRIRVVCINATDGLASSLLKFEFRVIGDPNSVIEIEAPEIVTKGEAILPIPSITNDLFITNSSSPIISTVEVVPEKTLVPIDVRETLVTAQLLDLSSVELFAGSIPIEWTVIGNGTMLRNTTYTNAAGKTKNTVRLSGPVNSYVQVKAKIKFAPSIFGVSPAITLFDSQIIGLRVIADKTEASTSEAISFDALAKTIDDFEFLTSDVTWSIEGSPDAIISASGEFVAFAPGEYRIRATLKSDSSISALSKIITVTSFVEFLDCNDNVIPIDFMTGLSKVSLGSIFAGNRTGTQEVRIRNNIRSRTMHMQEDILLNLATEPMQANVRTEFFPLAEDPPISIRRRGVNGNIQSLSIVEGFVENQILPSIDEVGIVTIYLEHVNISNVGIFNCGPNSCIGSASRNIFVRAKDSVAELFQDGDFYVDELGGKIFLNVSSPAMFPGKICYHFHSSAVVNLGTGEITLTTSVLDPNDVVFSSYKFKTGTLENLLLSVEDENSSDILISADGITFNKTANLGNLLPNTKARFYVRANTLSSDMAGLKSGNISLEADLQTITACA